MTSKTPTQPPAPAQPDQLPQAGGSYTRQPDGTLVPTEAAPLTPTPNIKD